MLQTVMLGLGLGFSAGISPGPMLALVLRETLLRGWRAGWTVAMAPLLADLPLVPLAVLLVGLLPAWIAGALSVAGGLFVIWMGVDSLRAAEPEAAQAPGGSLWRAVLTNILSPHPWIFWFTVGAPTLVRSWREGGAWWAAGFVLAFYLLLVGIKGLMATLVHSTRDLLRGAAYRRSLQASSVLLIGMGLLLVIEGVA